MVIIVVLVPEFLSNQKALCDPYWRSLVSLVVEKEDGRQPARCGGKSEESRLNYFLISFDFRNIIYQFLFIFTVKLKNHDQD